MGSSLGPLLTTVAFFFHHKRNWFRDCLIEYALIFYKLMDDIVILLKFENLVNMLLTCLNFKHPKIKLNMRTVDKCLVCFEFNFHRCNNSFEMSVHLKWTFSGVYTNCRSLIVTVYRSSLISTILYRNFWLPYTAQGSCKVEISFNTKRISSVIPG